MSEVAGILTQEITGTAVSTTIQLGVVSNGLTVGGSSGVSLGETSATAYRGDRGKTAYDHSQLVTGNPHSVTKSDVGLSNCDNTSDLNKPISTATQTALNAKQASGSYLTGNQTITFTGDATGSGTTSVTLTIPAGTVTLAKMANMATASLLGRNTAGSGAPEVLSAATAKSLLAIANTDVSGLGTLSTQSGTFSGTSSGVNSGDFSLPVNSGDYISSAVMSAAMTTSALAVNIIYFVPVFITKAVNITALAFSTVAVTAASYKVGVYASDSNKKATGSPISGTTTTLGPITTASATAQVFTFASAVAFAPGLYWIGILTDVSGTVGANSANASAWVTGTADVSVNQGRRMLFSQTYASGLPDMTSNAFAAGTGGNVIAGLKTQ